MDEGGNYQVIDRFFIEAPKSTLSQGAQVVRRTGDANVVNLGVSYELRCALNLYGEDCSTLCSPQDSDSQGHYLCNEEGDKVCLQGYEASMKISFGLCLHILMKLTCNHSFQGPNCTNATSSACFPSPCQNHGNCTILNLNYECVCLHGFTGTNCETTISITGVTTSTKVLTSGPYGSGTALATSETTVTLSGWAGPTMGASDSTTTCSADCTAEVINVWNNHVSTTHIQVPGQVTSSSGHGRMASTATGPLAIVTEVVQSTLFQMDMAASTIPTPSSSVGQ